MEYPKEELDEILQLNGPILFDLYKPYKNDFTKSTQESYSNCSLDNYNNIFDDIFNTSNNLSKSEKIAEDIYSIRDNSTFITQNIYFPSNFTDEKLQLSYKTISAFSESSQNVTKYELSDYNPGTLKFKQKSNDLRSPIIKSQCESITQHNKLQYNKKISSNITPAITQILKDISLLPLPIIRLYELIKESYTDFSFIFTISAQMCQDIVPMDSFVLLKLGLLLSIASIEVDDNKMPFPVVAIGSDTFVINLLMSNIANVAQRFTGPTDNFNSIFPRMNENGMIEAGSIILAKGGVCYLGDWSKFNTSASNNITRELDRGSLIINNPPLCNPIKCCIWCYVGFYKHNRNESLTFNTLLEVFGIPIIAEESPSEGLVNLLLDQALGVHTMEACENDFFITLEDIKTYLEVVSKRKVDMSADASNLLRKYFIASRIDRPDCLPQKAFTVLQQMSQSFAKLACRIEVLPSDVASAVYIAECFMHTIFGPGIYPSPKLKSAKFVEDVDKFFNEFQMWLSEYVERFGNNLL